MLGWSPSRIRRSLLKVVFKGRIVSGQRNCGQDPLKYLTNDGLDFRGTDAPTHISQINKLENQNKNLAVNVFSWDRGVIFDMLSKQLSKQLEAVPRTIPLLVEKATPG